MIEETLHIPVSAEQSVTAIRTQPESAAAGWLFVYAPGAGSNVHDPFGAYACRTLANQGYVAARFQFPYAESGRRRPDRPAVLEETWRQVVSNLREDGLKLVIGGRSMGGRIASHVVATGTSSDALALFAYPLHPPGAPSKLRDRHLPAIDVPTLFCSGTRDNFATPDELASAASLVSDSEVHLLDGADHGFNVLKSSGRFRQDVWEEAVGTFVRWLESR